MSCIVPTGTGLWITWNSSHTIDATNEYLVERAVAMGVSWICAKIGDDGRSTRWLKRGADLIARCLDASVGLYTWNYSRPDTWPNEAVAIAQTIAMGSLGHVIDAETEWEYVHSSIAHFSSSDRRPAASAFMARLRSELGDTFLAHAPIWRPQSHVGFPYEEFGSRCDAVMPQFYWTATRSTAKAFCAVADNSWAEFLEAHPDAAKAIMPIGITYGAGDGWDAFVGALSADDVVAFRDRYPTHSFFSWDAAGHTFWSALDRGRPTEPAPPDLGPVAVEGDVTEADRTHHDEDEESG